MPLYSTQFGPMFEVATVLHRMSFLTQHSLFIQASVVPRLEFVFYRDGLEFCGPCSPSSSWSRLSARVEAELEQHFSAHQSRHGCSKWLSLLRQSPIWAVVAQGSNGVRLQVFSVAVTLETGSASNCCLVVRGLLNINILKGRAPIVLSI